MMQNSFENTSQHREPQGKGENIQLTSLENKYCTVSFITTNYSCKQYC